MAQSYLPTIAPFNINATDLSGEYKRWMESYTFYELATGVSGKADNIRRATILHCMGPAVQRIFATLTEQTDTFDETKTALKNYFNPKKNIAGERHKFRSKAQGPSESIDDYVTSLRELAKFCEFGNL